MDCLLPFGPNITFLPPFFKKKNHRASGKCWDIRISNWMGITSIHILSSSLFTNKLTTGCYVGEVSDDVNKHKVIIFVVAHRVQLITSAVVKEQSLSLSCHVNSPYCLLSADAVFNCCYHCTISIHMLSSSLFTNKLTTGCYVGEVSDDVNKHKVIIFVVAHRVQLITSAVVKEQSLSLSCHVNSPYCLLSADAVFNCCYHCTIISVVIETWTARWQERG